MEGTYQLVHWVPLGIKSEIHMRQIPGGAATVSWGGMLGLPSNPVHPFILSSLLSHAYISLSCMI